MRMIKLGKTDKEISKMGLGTWSIGGGSAWGGDHDLKTVVDTICEAPKVGINLIDTAPCYGWGASEKIVGEAIRDFPRESFMISTKFSLVPNAHKPATRVQGGGSFKNIMREIATSLALLGTDYVDFYYLHYPDPQTDVAETMSALNVLKKRGLIRYIGVSNHSQEQIEAMLEWGDIDVIQPPFSMVSREQEELMKWAAGKGIDSMTYGSLGSGLLTGAMRTRPEFNPHDIRGGFYRKLYQEDNFNKFLKLLEVMRAKGDVPEVEPEKQAEDKADGE